MQTRFWIGSYAEYDIAQKEKGRLENDNPDAVYQIRKGTDKAGNLVFRVVQRFKNNEAKVLNENRQPKKRKKKKTEDLSWIRGS